MRCPSLADLPPPPAGKTGFPWTGASSVLPDASPLPRISIVTPSFNQKPFIEATIRSVLLQGYPNLEYVVMDGGSTDGTVEVIRQYAPWLDYWTSAPDRGQADAINRGLARATGEIVAWLNSDDTYLADTLATVARAFLADPEVYLVFGDCNIVDEESRVLEVIRPGAVDLRCVLLTNPIPQPAAFFRRRALDAVGLLDPNFRYALDHEFWVRVARQYRIAHLPQTLANFRMYRGSKSVSQLDGFLEEYITIFERAAQDARTARFVPAAASQREGLAHYNLGVASYGRGEMRAARQHLLRAARLYPALLRHARWFACFGKTFLGAKFTRAARRWRETRRGA
jgi:glycosyltransferase involved in cell wall biosynthesis